MLFRHELDNITAAHDAACDAALTAIAAQRESWETLSRLALANIANLRALEANIERTFINEHHQSETP